MGPPWKEGEIRLEFDKMTFEALYLDSIVLRSEISCGYSASLVTSGLASFGSIDQLRMEA